jgi:hypothetical protein
LSEIALELSILGIIWIFLVIGHFEKWNLIKKKWLLYIVMGGLILTNIVNIFVMKSSYRPAVQGIKEDLLVSYLEKNSLLNDNNPPPRVLLPVGRTIRVNSGMVYGFSFVNAFAGLHLTRVWNFVHGILNIDVPKMSVVNFSSEIFYKHGTFPYESMNLLVGLNKAANKLEVRSNPDPRIYLSDSYTRTKGWQESLALMRQGHAFRDSPLVEKQLQLNSQAGDMGAGIAEITHFGINEIRVRVDVERESLLVLAEAWYPGWMIKFKNQERESFPVNVWMRGALVPAGQYELTFFYRSTYMFLGACLSAIAIFLLCSVWFYKVRSRLG